MPMDILGYVQEGLRKAGSRRWGAIAAEVGCPEWLPRKIVYYKPSGPDPSGPGVFTLQPLFDLCQAVDRGERSWPEPAYTTSDSKAEG